MPNLQFQALSQAAKKLEEEAANALALAESLSGGAVRYLVGGAICFLVVRIAIGLLSNRALERRYMQWRADRNIAHGFNWLRSALLSGLLASRRLGARMGVVAQVHARRFSWRQAAGELVHLYDQLLIGATR